MNQLVKLFVLGVFFVTSVGVFAQDHEAKVQHRTPEETAKRMTDKLAKELGLSEKQQKEVYEINLKYSTEVDKRQKQKEEERKAKIESHQAVRQNRDAALKNVLTEEQYMTMQKNKEERQKEVKMKQKAHKMEKGARMKEHKEEKK